jgi:hypothetical protein
VNEEKDPGIAKGIPKSLCGGRLEKEPFVVIKTDEVIQGEPRSTV